VVINAQPTTPTAPTTNAATNFSQTIFTANWSGSTTATGYRLDVATDNGFSTFVSGYSDKDLSNVTTYSVTGLTANTTYYYRVRAYNACGASPNSGTITATTLPNPPSAPSASAATTIVQTSFVANWNSSATATGYRLDVATDNGFTTFLSGYNDKDVSNITTCSVTGLIANTTYYYRIRAYNTGGASLNSITITVTTLPNPPSAPSASAATTIVQTSFTAKWNTSATSIGYRFDVATNSGFTTFVTGFTDKDVSNVTTYNITGLSAKTTYYYRVRAYNTGGNSPNSNTITVTTLTNPSSVPTGLTASSCNDLVTLKWKKSTGPDFIRYRIYGGTTSNPTTITDSTTNSISDTIKIISGLTRGQTYYFHVTAVNYDGVESSFSDQSTAIVKTGVVPRVKAKWSDLLICYNQGDSIKSFQWYKGSTAITGETKQYYKTDKKSGVYKVETIDLNGCKNSSNIVSVTGTKSLSAYPNPAHGSFVLSLNDESQGMTIISIINSTGIKVLEFQTEKTEKELLKEISVTNLPYGVYQVQVLVNNEDFYFTQIVVVK
jgi:uncharacterized protein YaaQ